MTLTEQARGLQKEAQKIPNAKQTVGHLLNRGKRKAAKKSGEALAFKLDIAKKVTQKSVDAGKSTGRKQGLAVGVAAGAGATALANKARDKNDK